MICIIVNQYTKSSELYGITLLIFKRVNIWQLKKYVWYIEKLVTILSTQQKVPQTNNLKQLITVFTELLHGSLWWVVSSLMTRPILYIYLLEIICLAWPYLFEMPDIARCHTIVMKNLGGNTLTVICGVLAINNTTLNRGT